MSNRSTEEWLMDYMEYRVHKHLQLYVPPVLLLIGTVGNVLSFCVLMRRTMRVTSTYNYLAVLALLDTLVLYGDCLLNWLGDVTTAGGVTDQSEWSCKLINMIVYTVSVSSVWLLIAVTVDRYIATVHGIHAMTMCTQRRAVRIICCVIVCVTLLHMHFFWTMELHAYQNGYNCQSSAKYEYLVEHIWPWIDGFLYSFAPFAIIVTLNTLIVAHIVKSKRSRQCLSGHRGNGELSPSRSRRDNSFHVTIMLLVVSFSFLVCTFPTAAFMIYRGLFVSYHDLTYQQLARLILAKSISKLLLYTNHSINFYLYLLSGQRFRQEMCAMMRGCCWRGKYQQSPKVYYRIACRENSDVVNTMAASRTNNVVINATTV